MRISDDILRALEEAVQVVGSAAEFSRISCVDKSLLSRYLSGKVKNISDGSWDKIRPLIISYLNADIAGLCPLGDGGKECPLRNDENMEILKYFINPKNKSQRYSVLLEIEQSKKN